MKKLYRSRVDRKIAGVCGGVGEYFDLDPTLVRLAFVILGCLAGSGLFFYIVCALIIPEPPINIV